MTQQMYFRAHCAVRAVALCAVFAGLSGSFANSLAAQTTPAPAVTAPVVGVANINITPRRVIFDRTKRTEAVYVFNQGNASVTVDVALVDNVMLPTGELVPVARAADKGQAAVAQAATIRSSRPLLLAAPSRLTLAPGQGKTIRLRATLPDSTDAAEYRTHLTVTTVPTPDAGLTAEQAAAMQRGELVLRIQSTFGISIPLIVRNGVVDATASLGPIHLTQDGGKPALEVPVRRQGASSVYGNLEARAGKNEIVGFVRGLAVYPELSERAAKIPLIRPLRNGETVTVRYFSEDAKAGSALASGSFTAP